MSGRIRPAWYARPVLRELERGGQVFFVHNRVQTIGAMASHLDKLVPEARITIAHGQMAENELANAHGSSSRRRGGYPAQHLDHRIGPGYPQRQHADRRPGGHLRPGAALPAARPGGAWGAARLRLFLPPQPQTTHRGGRQRLETIAENTQLGAGFSIAMRDLEIRGTGDILGTRQHGHIAAVGFHLYTRLLAEAVRRLPRRAGSKVHNNMETLEGPMMAVTVELPIPVSLPADYISDKTIRLGIYRRMATLQTNGEVDALEAEFRDRFGEPPEIVRNLFYQLKIKLLAEQAGLASINSEMAS